MPASARLPSGTRVEVLCGHPGQKYGGAHERRGVRVAAIQDGLKLRDPGRHPRDVQGRVALPDRTRSLLPGRIYGSPSLAEPPEHCPHRIHVARAPARFLLAES